MLPFSPGDLSVSCTRAQYPEQVSCLPYCTRHAAYHDFSCTRLRDAKEGHERLSDLCGHIDPGQQLRRSKAHSSLFRTEGWQRGCPGRTVISSRMKLKLYAKAMLPRACTRTPTSGCTPSWHGVLPYTAQQVKVEWPGMLQRSLIWRGRWQAVDWSMLCGCMRGEPGRCPRSWWPGSVHPTARPLCLCRLGALQQAGVQLMTCHGGAMASADTL